MKEEIVKEMFTRIRGAMGYVPNPGFVVHAVEGFMQGKTIRGYGGAAKQLKRLYDEIMGGR